MEEKPARRQPVAGFFMSGDRLGRSAHKPGKRIQSEYAENGKK
jgi:hypothetical protein